MTPLDTEFVNMTEAEYLELERSSDHRHEFVAGMVYSMVGEKWRHKLAVTNIERFLARALKDTPCDAYTESIKVKAEAARSYYYPDVFVRCGQVDLDAEVELHPVLIVEVLSKSTATIDRREKRSAYNQIPSLSTYIIANAHYQEIELNTRAADGIWATRRFRPQDGDVPISVAGLSLRLPFSTIYENFEPLPPIRVKEEGAEYEWWNE